MTLTIQPFDRRVERKSGVIIGVTDWIIQGHRYATIREIVCNFLFTFHRNYVSCLAVIEIWRIICRNSQKKFLSHPVCRGPILDAPQQNPMFKNIFRKWRNLYTKTAKAMGTISKIRTQIQTSISCRRWTRATRCLCDASYNRTRWTFTALKWPRSSCAERRRKRKYFQLSSTDVRRRRSLASLSHWTPTFTWIFIHQKFGSNIKSQQCEHKYKQDRPTIQNTTIKSITVVDTWYWSINKISYIIIFVYQA